MKTNEFEAEVMRVSAPNIVDVVKPSGAKKLLIPAWKVTVEADMKVPKREMRTFDMATANSMLFDDVAVSDAPD